MYTSGKILVYIYISGIEIHGRFNLVTSKFHVFKLADLTLSPRRGVRRSQSLLHQNHAFSQKTASCYSPPATTAHLQCADLLSKGCGICMLCVHAQAGSGPKRNSLSHTEDESQIMRHFNILDRSSSQCLWREEGTQPSERRGRDPGSPGQTDWTAYPIQSNLHSLTRQTRSSSFGCSVAWVIWVHKNY